MGRILIKANYTAAGTKGLLKDGGSKRKQVVQDLIIANGGTLESFYFAFGDTDVYVIAQLPDNVTAAAISLAISATGMASTKVTVLLSPEEVDAAANHQVNYSPPGS